MSSRVHLDVSALSTVSPRTSSIGLGRVIPNRIDTLQRAHMHVSRSSGAAVAWLCIVPS